MKKANRKELIATINLTLARMNLILPGNAERLNMSVLETLADYARASPHLLKLSIDDRHIQLNKLDPSKEIKQIFAPTRKPLPLKGVQIPLFEIKDEGEHGTRN